MRDIAQRVQDAVDLLNAELDIAAEDGLTVEITTLPVTAGSANEARRVAPQVEVELRARIVLVVEGG